MYEHLFDALLITAGLGCLFMVGALIADLFGE